MRPERYALYRHFDSDGVLLYVGITADPERRLVQHRQKSAWVVLGYMARVEVEWYPSEVAAREAEVAAIRQERPVFNKARRMDGSAPSIPAYIRTHRRRGELLTAPTPCEHS